MAMWVIAVVAVAPCQCFSPGGNQMMSPGRISSFGPLDLHPPQTRCHNEGLPQRMRMPGRAGTWLERHKGAANTRGRLP